MLPNENMLLLDETFWVAVSITLIFLVIFKYSKSPFKNSLNSRSENISKQIDEAQNLLNEAEKLLAEQKKLHKKYVLEALNINNSIEEKIETLKQKPEKDFNEKLAQKTAAVKERIINHQHKLLDKLRIESVQIAIKTITIIMQKQDSNKANNQILTDSLNNLL